MTNQEAINVLSDFLESMERLQIVEEYEREAAQMGIEALKQTSCTPIPEPYDGEQNVCDNA
jgi:hypothetical protein